MPKAITVHQPFASLIAAGVKRYETRTWSTQYRGPLLIHAGIGTWGRGSTQYAAKLHRARLLPALDELPTGAILAIAELVHIVPSDTVARSELLTGPWMPGRYAWQLDNIRMLPEPIPWRGRVGLWDGPDVVVEAMPTAGVSRLSRASGEAS